MDLKARIAELARIAPASTAVVSVYRNTHWRDEHQRDRVRVFLKNALAQARADRTPGLSEADLRWVEGEALLSQTSMPEARGAALFACEATTVELAEAMTVRVIAMRVGGDDRDPPAPGGGRGRRRRAAVSVVRAPDDRVPAAGYAPSVGHEAGG
jgi:hypothetical protein